MSTQSRIGYLENGVVKSISCHSDGYISFNGVLLQEHYKDINKIKELVASGNAAHLGTKVSNTSFYKDEDEKAITEPLNEYIHCASYHYLYDVNENQWKVYNDRNVALLSNATNNLSSFARIEGNIFRDIKEAFKMCHDNKEAFACGWQSWWTKNSDYIQSIIDRDSMCIDVYYYEYQQDDRGNRSRRETHLYIPFETLSEAEELSDAVYGKTIDEIKKEFGEKFLQPSLDDKIEEAADQVKVPKPDNQSRGQTLSYTYKGEF